MVVKMMRFGNILIFGISIIISIILPFQLIYLSKILAIFILISVLILLVLTILNVKNNSNVQIWLSSFSVILLLIIVIDNGLFYRINADIVYQDKYVFIVDKNEPTAIMSCGTTFTLFVKKYWGFRGYEIIPNKYCFTELPKIELNNEKKVYTFILAPNGYVHGTIIFQLESEEIIFNVKPTRDLD